MVLMPLDKGTVLSIVRKNLSHVFSIVRKNLSHVFSIVRQNLSHVFSIVRQNLSISALQTEPDPCFQYCKTSDLTDKMNAAQISFKISEDVVKLHKIITFEIEVSFGLFFL